MQQVRRPQPKGKTPHLAPASYNMCGRGSTNRDMAERGHRGWSTHRYPTSTTDFGVFGGSVEFGRYNSPNPFLFQMLMVLGDYLRDLASAGIECESSTINGA